MPRYDAELAEGDIAGALITVTKGTGDTSVLAFLPHFISEPFMRLAMRAQAREAKPGEVLLKDLIPTMHYDARVVAGTTDKIKSFGQIKSQVLLINGTKSPANLRIPVGILAGVLPYARKVELNGANHLAATNGERQG